MGLKKSHMPQRWAVLTLCSIMMIGSYYCYDNPAALQEPMKTWFDVPVGKGGTCGNSSSHNATAGYEETALPEPLSAEEYPHMRAGDRQLLGFVTKSLTKSEFNYYFNLLYTVYSIPNVVLPFFGGFFVSKLGARWMNVLFSSCILAGQIVFSFGLTLHSFPLMLAGRVLFGLGGESLCVGQSTIVAQWFEGKELALALGINLSIARVGSAINDKTSPAIAELFGVNGLPYALFAGAIICACSLTCALIVVPLDRRADKKITAYRMVATSPQSPMAGELELEEEKVNFSDVKEFPLAFWLLTLSCIVVYGCVLPFNNIASSFIVERFICNGECCKSCNPNCEAGRNAVSFGNTLMGIPFYISAAASPFLGGLVDRVGGRAIFATVSAVILIGVHGSLIFFRNNVDLLYAPLVFQGIAYSVYASALWPSVPYIVSAASLGTAYGLLTALQNGGLALFPIIVATILSDTGDDYGKVEIFFATLAVLGTLVGIALNIDDYFYHDSVLNRRHFHEEDEEDLLNSAGTDRAALMPDQFSSSDGMDPREAGMKRGYSTVARDGDYTSL